MFIRIDALKSIAMFPEKGVAAVEAGDLLFKGFNEIPTITGGTVTKEYLVSEFKKSEATISSLSLDLKRKLDGTYPLDEAFARRLVMERDHLMAELDKFSKKALGGVDDETTKKNLEDCFNACIREVTERNNLIFRYNFCVKRIEDTSSEKDKHKAEDKKLKDMMVKKNDPDLPTIAAHIGTIYQSSRSRVMRLLDILLRALGFRMLAPHGVLDFTSDSNRNDVPLSLTFIELKNARGNIEQMFHRQVEAWGSEPERFPPNFSRDRGKRYHMDGDHRKKLITKHSVSPV